MSSYQADWYLDEEGNLDAELASNGDDEDLMGSNDDATVAAKEAGMTLKNARANEEYPDEMDTPHDKPARQRFARYRALQSFRSSPWHPKENLPQEYSKIYQFENFGMAQRRAVNEVDAMSRLQNNDVLSSHTKLASVSIKSRASSFSAYSSGGTEGERDDNMMDIAHAYNPLLVPGSSRFVKSGQYVEIEIRGVLRSSAELMMSTLREKIVTLFNLLPDENKLSVLHFNVQLVNGEVPVKSKEPLIFQVGFRTFAARPIFSEANLNCDKHKMERFLQPGRFAVATIYAPITYLPCPALIFKATVEANISKNGLIATGTLLSIDPDRIILKKVLLYIREPAVYLHFGKLTISPLQIVLTGIPIRVRKRYAVIKHMFFDPLDVRWFKPAELHTKYGLRGNIKEPVGTHGLFKAVFSAPITQNDTVMLVIYKRVFPKLPNNSHIVVG